MVAKNWLVILATFIAFALSVSLWFSGDKEAGMYVGIWVPSILAYGAFISLSRKDSHHV